MPWQQILLLFLLTAAAIISATLSILTWRRRPGISLVPLTVLLLAVAEWTLSNVFQLGMSGLEIKVFWAKFAYFGVVIIPPALLVFALQYTNREQWVTRRNLALLAIEPLVAVVMVWTNDGHHLWWSEVSLDTGGIFPALYTPHGPLFWIHAAYTYLLILTVTVFVFQMITRSPTFYRGQAAALLVGILAPWVSNVLFISGLSPLIDPTPLAFTVTGVALSWGLLRYRLFDITPIARDAVIKNMGDGLIVLDTQNRIVELNPAAQQILGLGTSPTIGQPVEQILPDALHYVNDTSKTRAEIVLSGENGQRFLDLRFTPLYDHHGRLRSHLIILRDISERKQFEKALRRRLQEASLLHRVTALATSTIDTQAILETICQELAFALDLPQTAFGLLDDDGENVTVIAEYLPEGRPPAKGVIISVADNLPTRRVLETYAPLVVPNMQTDPGLDEHMRQEAKRRGTISLLLLPVIVADRVIGTLGLDATEPRDFTPEEIALAQNVAATAGQMLERAQLYEALQQELVERTRAQQELRQANIQLAEASRLKSHFLANMSHELRTPLNSILGYTEMIGQGIYGPVSDTQSDRLAKIIRNGQHLTQLINDILDLSKIEAGRMEIYLETTDIAAIVDECLSAMETLAQQKGLRLQCDIAPLPPMMADSIRLLQILTNLIGNAIKFTPSGTITVRAAPLLSAEDARIPQHLGITGEHWVLLTVEDTGIGIAPEDQELIFDEFRQVDGSPTREYEGTGLGLAISHHLVEMMGGHIWVESAVDEGSKFFVALPAVSEK